MQNANPFLYILQIGTFLLLIPAGREGASNSTTAWTADPDHDKARHVPNAPVGLDGRPYKLDPLGPAMYCADAAFSAPAVPHSTSTASDINTVPEATAINGHGGTARMQNANPFLYILQIGTFLLLIPAGREGASNSTTAWTADPDHDKARHVPNAPVGLDGRPYKLDPLGPAMYCADAAFSAPAVPHSTSTASDINTVPEATAINGHGGTARMQNANPFLYILQVRKRYGECTRSDYPCLIVLPCPRLLCEPLCNLALYLKELLLLGGDIETNPGPDLAQISLQLTQIATDLKEIKEERLTAIEAKLESLAAMDKKIMDCTTKVSALQKTVSDLELKLDDLENRSRRSNLIVYGIPEDEQENEESLEEVINDQIAKTILEIEPVSIERIHRFGKPNPNKTRPIILKLLDDRDKTKILKNCHKLKGSEISISEDFSKRVRLIRKKLWDSAKPNKESGQKVHLVYDKISIDRTLYRWDDSIDDKVLVNQTTNSLQDKKNHQSAKPATRSRNRQK
ncbi:uncharacterized protein LOC144180217 [Haemaphysalis longicornis]